MSRRLPSARAVAALLAALLVPPAAPLHADFVSRELPYRATVAAGWSGVAPCLARSGPAGGNTSRGAARAGAAAAGQPATESEAAAEALRRLIADSGETPGAELVHSCRDFDCAARRLFGEDIGPRFLQLAVAYHFVAAQSAATPRWTAAELDEVLSAFRDLPGNLFPLERNGWRGIWQQHGSGRIISSPIGLAELVARSGEGVRGIVLADAWRKIGKNERRVSLVHELAHEFTRARGGSFNWRNAWLEVMAADHELALSSGLGDARVSQYAKANMDDDFAESVAAYRYMAPALRSRAPHRYAFLKDWMFDGLEYGSASKCEPARARSEQVKQAARAYLRIRPLSPQAAERIVQACRTKADKAQCVIRAAYVQHYRQAWDDAPAVYPAASLSALDALITETDFIDRAVRELPPEAYGQLAAELTQARPDQFAASGLARVTGRMFRSPHPAQADRSGGR